MKDWIDDFRVAVAFLTRVPVPHPDGASPPNFARSHRVFPLVGALIGGVIGLVHWGLLGLGLPALAAAALALGAGMLLTGALHEDGLADVADGFGGGRDKAAKLEIMRDSRLGTFGAAALVIALVAKLSALAALAPVQALPALVAAHALARGFFPVMNFALPPARDQGLAASAGRPTAATAWFASLFAILVALLVLPLSGALAALAVTVLALAAVTLLALRHIGGQTGDVFGCAEQVAETAVLLVLAAYFA